MMSDKPELNEPTAKEKYPGLYRAWCESGEDEPAPKEPSEAKSEVGHDCWFDVSQGMHKLLKKAEARIAELEKDCDEWKGMAAADQLRISELMKQVDDGLPFADKLGTSASRNLELVERIAELEAARNGYRERLAEEEERSLFEARRADELKAERDSANEERDEANKWRDKFYQQSHGLRARIAELEAELTKATRKGELLAQAKKLASDLAASATAEAVRREKAELERDRLRAALWP